MSLPDFHPYYLTLEEQQGAVVAAVNVPRLTDEDNIDQLGQEMFALAEQFNFRSVVLNIESVEYLTSAVLGKMISLHRKLHRYEGKLVICGVCTAVAEILKSSRLEEYFNIASDVDAAIQMLN